MVHEALTTSAGMTTKTPGVGSVYLGTYKDKDGSWLDGANMAGSVRVTPGVGDAVTVSAGDTSLVEDTTGSGHVRAVEPAAVLVLVGTEIHRADAGRFGGHARRSRERFVEPRVALIQLCVELCLLGHVQTQREVPVHAITWPVQQKPGGGALGRFDRGRA